MHLCDVVVVVVYWSQALSTWLYKKVKRRSFYSLILVMWMGAWVTQPEGPEGAKDEVKRPKGPPAGRRGPEGPALYF